MSLSVCIPDLIASGKLTGERADRAQALYDELLLQHERRYGRAAAEAMATEQTVRALERDTLDRQRQALLTIKAQQTIDYQARHVFDGGAHAGAPISGQALRAHLVRDPKARGIANVEYRWHRIKQDALGRIYDLLAQHRPNLLGEVRNKADLRDIVDELHGKDSGNANASELATAWRDTTEWLRRRFNAAGGTIGKLNDWGLPHLHDATRVGSATREAWIDFTLPLLDRARMADRLTGAPLGDMRLRAILADTYESILSDGWDSRPPGSQAGRAVANRHGDQRFLHFSDADAWMSYHDRFGAGDIYSTMMGHVERMSRDTAMIEILGPNPEATVRWMQDMATKEAATHGTMRQRSRATIDGFVIGRLWDEITGANRGVVNRRLALIGSTLRNWQTSSRLGSAVLASMSDHATTGITLAYNGLPITGQMEGYLRQLNPFDSADRDFIRRAGIISDELTGRMHNSARLHVDEAFGGGRLDPRDSSRFDQRLEQANEVSRRLADGVLRTSGLNGHTVALREAIAREFLNAVTSFRGIEFGALDKRWRGFLDRYGINAERWEAIRTSGTVLHRGSEWITPETIAAGPGGQALADRLMEGIFQEIEHGVPTGGLALRAAVSSTRPGTWLGEIIRTGFQFKMFPMTVVAMHASRAMAQGNLSQRAGYAAAFLATTTVIGALSVQLAELSKGRDPMPMGSRDFVRRAMLKGGGLGIYGDAIQYSSNEYGQNIGTIFAGPGATTAQVLFDTAWATGETAIAQTASERSAAARRRSRAVGGLLREVPGSSLWFTRAAYERLVIDSLRAAADPDYASTQRALLRRARGQGQAYFLPPADGATGGIGAARLPDLSNALAPAPPPR